MTTEVQENKATSKSKTQDENILKMAQIIEGKVAGDSKTGVSPTEDDAYNTTLEISNATPEMAKTIHDHDEKFRIASRLAIGRVAGRLMSENPELQTVETVIKVGEHNLISLDVERSREYRNPRNPEEPTTKYLVTNETYDVNSSPQGAKEMKIAKASINELGLAAMKK